jgi:hypothetical protein
MESKHVAAMSDSVIVERLAWAILEYEVSCEDTEQGTRLYLLPVIKRMLLEARIEEAKGLLGKYGGVLHKADFSDIFNYIGRLERDLAALEEGER